MSRCLHVIAYSCFCVFMASTTNAADCWSTLDNSCFSLPMAATPAVDCRTTFDARCLPSQATEAEIAADTDASQRRIEALLQEQQAEATRWDRYDQQEAVSRMQEEWAAGLLAAGMLPTTVTRLPDLLPQAAASGIDARQPEDGHNPQSPSRRWVAAPAVGQPAGGSRTRHDPRPARANPTCSSASGIIQDRTAAPLAIEYAALACRSTCNLHELCLYRLHIRSSSGSSGRRKQVRWRKK